MSRVISVKTAELQTARAPDALSTLGIGSCVAVCLYDQAIKLGGLAHVMLPQNEQGDLSLIGKFADTGIAELIRMMVCGGASQARLTAKITGGASVLSPGKPPVNPIGQRNIEAVRKALSEHKIRIVAEDMGGVVGRGLVFYTESGAVEVSVLTRPPGTVVL